MDLIAYLKSEWKVISQAPVTFIVGAIIIFGLTYAWARHQFGERLATAEDRLRLKDDQLGAYRDQLEGASPDEVRGKIDRLQQEVETYKFRSRRQLSPSDVQLFSRIVSREKGAVTLIRDLRSASAKRLCRSLIEAFQAGGWAVTDGWNEGSNIGSPVVVSVSDEGNLSAREAAVRDALEACDVEFVIKSAARLPIERHDDVIVYVNSESLMP